MSELSYMAGAAIVAMAISSCDEDTLVIGNSITNESDKLEITTCSFQASSKTIKADSVLALATECYLGKVKDPETESVVTSEFSTQFHALENMILADEKYIVNKDADGRAQVDSCDLILFLGTPYKNDSLMVTKLLVSELETPIEGGKKFYSNYDPTQLIRKKENGGISIGHSFTFQNRTDIDSTRNSKKYQNNIRIPLNQPYTAKDGKTYSNYGTYVLRQYYDNRSNFTNTYRFIHNVCPGFFFQITDGLGFHSQVSNIGLRLYYNVVKPDTAYKAAAVFAGTKEVLQCVKITNDKQAIEKLAQETSHTYLKSPAGLFTEVTLPVAEIKKGHEADSLLATNITFQRLNNESFDKRMFSAPKSILMLQKDSLYSFFEKNKLPDNRTSYISLLTSNTNVYNFQNISALISQLWKIRQEGLATDPNWEAKHQDWNKVVLVPVSYATSSTSSTTITKVEHDMALESTKLVGGEGSPIKVSIVYGKFK